MQPQTRALAKTKPAKKPFEKLSDVELRTLGNNARGVLEHDPLFRRLREKGDIENVAKFFSRMMEEHEYKNLMRLHKIDVDESPKEETVEETRLAKTMEIVVAERKAKALAKVMGYLGRKGWTTGEIATSLAVVRELDFPKYKLTQIAKLGVDAKGAETFLRAHADMRALGAAAANSGHFFSFQILAEIYFIFEKDEKKLDDFLDFCMERVQEIGEIKDLMQLGNRGRIRDIRTALSRMIEIYEMHFGISDRIEDYDVLDELSAELEDRYWGYPSTEELISSVEQLDLIQCELARWNIELTNNEERDVPDLGNFNAPRRRRWYGF